MRYKNMGYKYSHAEYSNNFDFFPFAERALGWPWSEKGPSWLDLDDGHLA